MRPKTVKCNNAAFPGFVDITLGGTAPADSQGCPRGATQMPFTLTLIREIAAAPGTQGFALATGDDGSLRSATFEIELQNAAGQVTQTLNLADAYVAGYTTRGSGDDLVEEWVVHAGDVRISAGDAAATFDPEWQLLPDGL